MKQTLFAVLTLLLCGVAVGQELSDKATAGFTHNRTYFNAEAGDLKPPYEPFVTIPLEGVSSADVLLPFEEYFLVGEGGTSATYRLFDQAGGPAIWTTTVAGNSPSLDYVPAYADDIVVLGGSATTTVKAVRISTGGDLWSNPAVGSATGRYPVNTGNVAVYHGQNSVVVADAATGLPFWSLAASTAQAPVSVFGSRLYFLEADGSLQARNLLDGSPVWSTDPGAGSNGSNIIATEKYVFASNPAIEAVGALNASDGSLVWGETLSNLANPGIALAYGQLFVFYRQDLTVTIRSYQAETGELLWEYQDPTPSLGGGVITGIPRFGQVANNVVYFYNTASERIRALDAFSGTLLGSINVSGVKDLVVSRDRLYALRDDSVEVFRAVKNIYFAHVADGEGAAGAQSTLLTLTSLSNELATGTVYFYDNDGVPLEVEVDGLAGPVTSVDFNLGPHDSARIQTMGLREIVSAGWAIVEADQPISGTAIFQFSLGGDIFFEAGVGNSVPVGSASLYVSRFQTSTPDTQFNTGVAIGNPSDQTATIELEYRRTAPTEASETTTINLGPGEHIAEFLDELFGEEFAPVGSEGTLIIRSDLPVVITALRTQGGFQMSSYPVGQVR